MTPVAAPPLPKLSSAACEVIVASIVEWKRSTRSLLFVELSELWVAFDLEHGFDSTGRLVAERPLSDPDDLRLLDYKPDGIAMFTILGEPRARLVEHAGWFRPTVTWSHFEDAPTTKRYVDGDWGVERIQVTVPNYGPIEYVYERGSDGRLLSVTQVDAYTKQQLWPVAPDVANGHDGLHARGDADDARHALAADGYRTQPEAANVRVAEDHAPAVRVERDEARRGVGVGDGAGQGGHDGCCGKDQRRARRSHHGKIR